MVKFVDYEGAFLGGKKFEGGPGFLLVWEADEKGGAYHGKSAGYYAFYYEDPGGVSGFFDRELYEGV